MAHLRTAIGVAALALNIGLFLPASSAFAAGPGAPCEWEREFTKAGKTLTATNYQYCEGKPPNGGPVAIEVYVCDSWPGSCGWGTWKSGKGYVKVNCLTYPETWRARFGSNVSQSITC